MAALVQVGEAESDASPAAIAPDTKLGRGPLLAGAVIGLSIAAGAVVRLRAASHNGNIDSDQAVVGLMAKHLLEHGEWPVFYWGQTYGGTLDLIGVAASFKLFGQSPWSLRALSVLLTVVSGLILHRVAKRIHGSPGAWLATVAYCCPVQFIGWFAAREMLFYQTTLLIGLGSFLLALQSRDRPSYLALGGIGALTGLGFWSTAMILYFALPILAFLARPVLRDHRRLGLLGAATIGTILGALPWILYNARHPLASLNDASAQKSGSALDQARILVTRGFAFVLGGASTEGYDLWWHRGGILFTIVVAGLLILGIARSRPAWRRGGVPLDVLALAAMPVVFCIMPVNVSVFVPRYFFLPWVIVVLAAGRIVRTWPQVMAGCVTVVLVAVMTLDAPTQRVTARPPNIPTLISLLDDADVHAVRTDYWFAYLLAFESHERIVAAPFFSSRLPAYDEVVRSQPRVAVVLLCNSPVLAAVKESLTAAGRTTEVIRRDQWMAVITDGADLPADLKLSAADPGTVDRCPA